MEAQDDKTIQIPMEDGKEALKQRQEIISQVYADGRRKTLTKEYTTAR